MMKFNLKSNLGLKVLSVVFAIFLWFIVSSSEYTTITVYAPVDIVNVPDNCSVNPEVKFINVVLRGSSLLINNVKSGSVKAIVDVNDLNAGKNEYFIKRSDIRVPPGIKILDFTPKKIIITIDRLTTKKVKVVPQIIGKVKQGLYLENIEVKPFYITISGSEREIKDVTSIKTFPIDISEEDSDRTVDVDLMYGNNIKDISPRSVNVKLDFEEEIIEKTFNNVAIEIANNRLKVINYIPKSVKIRLRARSDILTTTSLDYIIKVFVDTSDIKRPGVYLKEIDYKLIEKDVELINIVPDSVRIKLSK
ncbi:MAG: CdaR family protein [Deferribacterota bacterium]|nr:CdaR family protein [Deferribacterota bacterium]